MHIPSIYCHRLVLGKNYRKPIEKLKIRKEKSEASTSGEKLREIIARRAALEFKDGMYGEMSTVFRFSPITSFFIDCIVKNFCF